MSPKKVNPPQPAPRQCNKTAINVNTTAPAAKAYTRPPLPLPRTTLDTGKHGEPSSPCPRGSQGKRHKSYWAVLFLFSQPTSTQWTRFTVTDNTTKFWTLPNRFHQRNARLTTIKLNELLLKCSEFKTEKRYSAKNILCLCKLPNYDLAGSLCRHLFNGTDMAIFLIFNFLVVH